MTAHQARYSQTPDGTCSGSWTLLARGSDSLDESSRMDPVLECLAGILELWPDRAG